MEKFEYEYNEAPNSGGGKRIVLIIVAILLVASAFFIGAMSRDYFDILPDKEERIELEAESTDPVEDNETIQLTPTPEIVETPTPKPTDAPTQKPQIALQYTDIPTIVETVSKGVVSITGYYSSTSKNIEDWEPMSYGTGVIISEDGYIVTNNHVIDEAVNLTVTLFDGEKVEAKVIGKDKYVDLAVVKIEKVGLYNIPFGDSSKSKPGEQVIAIGSPLGDELTGTVTSGIISAVDRQLIIDGIPFTLLQTDAAINPGNSGGPLMNMKGELIGINTLKSIFAGYDKFGMAIAAEGISYAIPSNSVSESINDILEYGGIVRPFIGVFGSDVNNLETPDSNLPDGFLIAETVEESPAQLGGILAGDVIIKIEGEVITGFTDLYTIINSYEIGDTVIFTVYRPDSTEEIDLEITLGSNQDFNK